MWATYTEQKPVNHSAIQEIPPSMEPKGSLPCSQQPANGLYTNPEEHSPHFPNLFFYDPF